MPLPSISAIFLCGGNKPDVVLYQLFTDVFCLDSCWKIRTVGLFLLSIIFRNWCSLPPDSVQSVRLSVTLADCCHAARPIVTIFWARWKGCRRNLAVQGFSEICNLTGVRAWNYCARRSRLWVTWLLRVPSAWPWSSTISATSRMLVYDATRDVMLDISTVQRGPLTCILF